MPNLRFRRLSLYLQLAGVWWKMREDEAISHSCGKRITGGYPVAMIMSSNTSAPRKTSQQENCDELCPWKLAGSFCTGRPNWKDFCLLLFVCVCT